APNIYVEELIEELTEEPIEEAPIEGPVNIEPNIELSNELDNELDNELNNDVEEAWGSDVEAFMNIDMEGPLNVNADTASQHNSHGRQQQDDETGRITSNAQPTFEAKAGGGVAVMVWWCSGNAENGASDGNAAKKSLIVNAFVEMCSGHQSPGLWRHPDDQSARFNDVDHWTDLAQLLEKGKFHGIFIADVLGGYDVYGGPRNLDPAIRSGAQWPVNEPLAVIPAMASVTGNLGFGVTVATTYEQPYHLARRLSTIDHLTKGRLGWNIVTGYLDSAARNLGHTEQPEHDERYAIAEEYLDVMYKLFEYSWRDDAVTLDRERAIFTDPARVREINHVGKYYKVPGPHICQPSRQRTPLLMQAGTSKVGKSFAAKHAEAIFIAGHSPSVVAKNVAEVRSLAKELGRDPQNVKFLAMICPVLGRTQEDAERKFEEYSSLGSVEGALALFGGWTGIDMAQYGDDEELRHVESNAIRPVTLALSYLIDINLS
ncbi:MAG: hypothetical protein LQ342_008306, partial [Letrouitia transgressa]